MSETKTILFVFGWMAGSLLTAADKPSEERIPREAMPQHEVAASFLWHLDMLAKQHQAIKAGVAIPPNADLTPMGLTQAELLRIGPVISTALNLVRLKDSAFAAHRVVGTGAAGKAQIAQQLALLEDRRTAIETGMGLVKSALPAAAWNQMYDYFEKSFLRGPRRTGPTPVR